MCGKEWCYHCFLSYLLTISTNKAFHLSGYEAMNVVASGRFTTFGRMSVISRICSAIVHLVSVLVLLEKGLRIVVIIIVCVAHSLQVHLSPASAQEIAA